MRPVLLAPLPGGVVLLLALVAMMPWGGPEWLEPALALTAVGSVYFWSVRRPRLMPAGLVFVLGLLIDVMTHGPLGIWACATLTAGLAGRLARQSQLHVGWLREGSYLLATLVCAGVVVGVLASLHDGRLVSPWPVSEAVAVACVSYPVVAALLSLLDGFWPKASGRSMFVRGD